MSDTFALLWLIACFVAAGYMFGRGHAEIIKRREDKR